MSKEIKTRAVVKDIKVLDKASSATAHAKNAFIRSKQSAEATQNPQQHSADGYATDHLEGGAREVADGAVNRLKNPQNKIKENVNKAKEHFQESKRNLPKQRKQAAEQAKKTADNTKQTADTLKGKADQAKKTAEQAKKTVKDAKRTLQQTRQVGRQTVQTAKKTVKTGKQAEKTIKTSVRAAKATGKGTIKTVKKSVKTAEKSAKVAVKTAKVTAKAAQKSAQAAAKAAKMAAHAAKIAAKVAVVAAKAAVKVTVALVKAAIAAIKGLVALIAAGGWVAVLIIVIICLIGLLIGSIFGIFFSGEDSGTGYTMPMAIAEINVEFQEKLTEEKNKYTYDELQMTGYKAAWKDVLAVYAVKANADPENPAEVATMDENKKSVLTAVFWDMTSITSRTETKTVTVVTVTDDGEGNLVETEESVSRVFLYITVTNKTTDEMATQYGFSQKQKAQLIELLNPEYEDMWSAVLYGIGNNGGNIVEVAISQLGNPGGEPYWSWYGFSSRAEWCACFVSWCADECGYIDGGILPKFAACTSQGLPWFKDRGLWQDKTYTPKPGDIIFFDWDGSGNADHVGIIERIEGLVVHTVEGNTTDMVARRSYRMDSDDILGYGTPLY